MNLAQRLIFRLQTFLLLQGAYCALRVLPFSRVERIFIPATPKLSAKTKIEPREFLELLDGTAWRFSWLNTCLPRSIVLCRILRRAGFAATVVIGVQPSEVGNDTPTASALLAHAWVEDDLGNRYDRPNTESEQFTPLGMDAASRRTQTESKET